MVHVPGDHFLGCPSLNPKHPDIQPEMNVGFSFSWMAYRDFTLRWFLCLAEIP